VATALWHNLTERTSDDLVSPRIVKCDGVNDVPMPFQCHELFTSLCPPNLARSVVASCDELITLFVEGTVRQRQDVSSEYLEEKVVSVVVTL